MNALLAKLKKHCSLGCIKVLLLNPRLLFRLPWFFRELGTYRKMELEKTGKNVFLRYYPMLDDRQTSQSGHSQYFYQDCWAARQVFRERPPWGVDVGSTVLLVGILSQFAKWVSVDIRPIESKLEGLDCQAGSVLSLPFKDNEVPCLTTMCVIEHIGLGRYGDPLNPTGTHDAVAEIARVIKPGGIVVYSVPVGLHETLEFNAHRRFGFAEAASFFRGWEMVDSCMLTPSPAPYRPENLLNYPVGCFCLRKPLA